MREEERTEKIKKLEIDMVKEIRLIELENSGHLGYDLGEMERNKKDTIRYSVLRFIIQSNLEIPHNLISKPTDEYTIEYQCRLAAAQMMASEFKRITGEDING